MRLRYSSSVPSRALYDVPGVKVRRSDVAVGPPVNCRNLLTRKPIHPKSEPPWDKPPKALRDWVPGWLTDYQKEAWHYSIDRLGSNLWHACGAGKTATSICWGLSDTWGGPIVVITRATARRQWRREVERLSFLQPLILEGQTPEKIGKEVRMVIIGWECLPHWVGELTRWGKQNRFSVVFDEIHKAKSWKRKEKHIRSDGSVGYRLLDNIAVAAMRLAHAARRRLGLTATPIRNVLGDLWAQLDLIEPNCWGHSLEFKKRYCDAVQNQYGAWDENGVSNKEELQARLQEVCHVVKYAEMAKQLPPKRRQLCYLSRADQNRPAAFAADLKRAAKSGTQALFEMRLLEAASRKRGYVVETVLEAVDAKQKVVIFTGRRTDCERIAAALEKGKPDHVPLWWGHGGVSTKERDSMVLAYAACEEPSIFVGTTDAFGESMDGLQCTDLAIFSLLPWTPGQVTQAEGRFSRKGSKRPVLIMYMVAEGTVDEHVADILLGKLEAVSSTLNDSEAAGLASTLAGEQDEDAVIADILQLMEVQDGSEEEGQD